VVRADERRLRQTLINVLGNAVKFTSSGGVNFKVRYAREMAQFDIEDTGPGIKADELVDIFEPFVRGSSAQNTAIGGSGVGLTISKMLTDLMGGEMIVNSTPGVGSNFQIRLFLPQMHGAIPVAEVARQRDRSAYAGERRRILIVDNESVDRELLASVLLPLGFQIDQAASGVECMEVLPRFQPHLIFMDLAMPGIDGWETIRQIRQQKLSEAAIAIISANAFDKGLDNDVGIASEDFILKPVNVEHLLDWIGRKLSLTWIYAEPEVSYQAAKITAPAFAYPPAAELHALVDLAGMGYVRGILNKLDDIEAADSAYTTFVQQMRELTQQFQLDSLNDHLKKALHAIQ
jgi:CheY-like chemotaxis protein